MADKKKTQAPAVRSRCDVFGVDKICELIVSGESLTSIAAQMGVHVSTLILWAEKDAQRSAQMKEARRHSARLWDEKAESLLFAAENKLDLHKARELAHHYRWRARNIAPREYGEKVTNEHTGADGGPIAVASVDLKNLNDEELASMKALMSKAVGGKISEDN